ncbi:TPA: hypothetical protein P0E30_003752 [Vibrio harveyi]|nr:hypothetical protein [Vibrio harveyi]
MNKLMRIAAAVGSFLFPASIVEAAESKRELITPDTNDKQLILKPKRKKAMYEGGRRVWYTADSPEVKAMCKK